MSKRPRGVPSYRLHKPSGQARVIIAGRHIYLGKFGTAESHEAYHRTIAEWAVPSPSVGLTADARESATLRSLTIAEVILAYWKHVEVYYRKHGVPTGEQDNIRVALRPLRKLYGSTQASLFEPSALQAVQQAMVEAGLARTSINARINRIRRMFRWASVKKLVPAETYYGLKAVEELKKGRTDARETDPVRPVSDACVQATLPKLNSVVRSMVQVQWLSGMRPQDVRNLRFADIDRTGDVWVYRPWTHKTEHHEHERLIAIGPRAQAILKSFLSTDDSTDATKYLFRPALAAMLVRQERARQRRSPRTPSESRRSRKIRPQRAPGAQYTRSSYQTAIRRACAKANVPHWSPNQLRHSCATKVRAKYGLEGAAAVLGHRSGSVSERYAQFNFELAIRIMKDMG